MAEPARIGEFICDALIGEGGMGMVFRARQVALDRWVALKILPRAKENKDFIDRFYREARSAARLVHANIVQIHTVGEHQGIPYFTMEYIEGDDLENILKASTEPLSEDEIIEIVRSVIKALVLAMEHGIVHRDIKPANIMITKSGAVKIMDFGLAKGINTDDAATQAGLIIGTPTFMSPEQGASQPVDTRSDLYSLGCVMYQCICGTPPFKSDNVASLIYKHIYEEPEPPSKVRTINPAIEKICLKLMAKKPEDRYQRPDEVLEALAMVQANPTLAELALAKRSVKNFQLKKMRVANDQKTIITSSGMLGLPENKNDAGMPSETAPPSALRSTDVTIITPSGLLEMPSVNEPAKRAEAEQQSKSLDEEITLSEPDSAMESSPRLRASSSSAYMPTSETEIATKKKGGSKLKKIFQRLPDCRWSYKLEFGRCSFAEGLAVELPTPADKKQQGFGDCLLCSNWNKRVGCVVAYCQELESQSKSKGLKLLVEQSIAWMGAARFEKAIELLDNYVKKNPKDPDGYRELARIYERPDYRGRDKRRAIVLYQRFAEIAQTTDRFSKVEIQRAEERISVLSADSSLPEALSIALMPGSGIVFQCFYRGPMVCFCFGYLTSSRLFLARVGDVDPETGVVSDDMKGAVRRATTILRRFKSEQAKKEEQTLVKKELGRLSELSADAIQQDSTRILSIGCDQFTHVALNIDETVKIHCVTINTQQQMHQLLFNDSNAFKAEQCHELISRKLKR